ncbi:MAG: hypothetical protein IKP73_06035 [Bacteroidales bacterium]|nr:hypothetical protein [Bacteroidales bacterium]
MEKFFDTFKEAMAFILSVPDKCKCRWVAAIAKWVVTITAAYLIYASVTD